jgi:membrane-bound lytic murein transglycosylase D
MSKFRPVLMVLFLCGALITLQINSDPVSATFSATLDDGTSNPEFDKMAYLIGNSYIPREASAVLQASHLKYLKGCDLVQEGDSESARDYFNEAVDLLLSPNWDVTSTLHLNHFFQELIQGIPNGPSRYPDDVSGRDLDLFPLKITPSLEEEFSAHLGDTRYQIPITLNRTVAKSIYYWLNDGRRFYVEGLMRSGQYTPIIERIFREESVPTDLMYLAQAESLFKPTAVSKMLAKGIWQFNKSTAMHYGLKVTGDIDERSDPEKSTRAAARYLKDLYHSFGNWDLALAAYNCGSGRVRRLVQMTGAHDFWSLLHSGQQLPKETKNYIPLVHASIILARNPEKFDLPTELDPYIEYVEVAVPRPTDLRAAAKVLKTTVDDLKSLNPALKGPRTPAGYPGFRLKVPADSDVNLRERLVALSVMAEPYS